MQYKTFDWFYYPGESVDVYYYTGGKELAEYALQYTTVAQLQVEKLFDYSLQDRVELIVYNSQTDFRQSNIGIQDDDIDNVGGKTKIVGSKVFVFFNGDHGDFAQQIREGIAEVLFNQMMLGGNWKDVLRSSTFLSIPDWFREGIISYAGAEWDSQADQYIRDGIHTGLYDSFNLLNGIQERYAGHAIWKYIADVYGENVIPNILYMTKISRNVEDGFIFVLGEDLDGISSKYTDYWKSTFKSEESDYAPVVINRMYTDKQLEKQAEWKEKDKTKKAQAIEKVQGMTPDEESKSYVKARTLVDNWDVLGYEAKKWRKLDKRFSKYLGAIPVKFKPKYTYSQFLSSPDGKYVSFVTHEYGQYKVWLYEPKTGKLKRLAKRDYKIDRLQDDTYPNLAWHPSSQILSFIAERRGRVFLNNYDITENKNTEKELFRIEKVIDMSYSPDGKKIVFSGVALGQNDLYMYYTIGNNQTKLTDDIYDDLNPDFLPDGETIIFSSNRPDDTLREEVPVDVHPNLKDIFLFKTGESPSLERVTRTPLIDEDHPSAINQKEFTYLSYRKNFKNRYLASVDSAISRIDTTIHYRYFTRETAKTNLALQMRDYEINPEKNTFQYSFYQNGRLVYNWGKLDDEMGSSALNSTGGETTGSEPGESATEVFTIIPITEEEGEVDPFDYEFSDRTGKVEIEKEVVRIMDIEDPETADAEAEGNGGFELPKSQQYRLNFVIDEVTTQLDNSLGLEMYQSLSEITSINQGGGIGGMAKVSDLFEDHKLKGAMRLNASLSGLEGGVFYRDLSKRLDKKYSLQRFSNLGIVPNRPWILQTSLLLGVYELSYPFDEVRSLKGSLIGIFDNKVYKALEATSAQQESLVDLTAGARIAYVYDDTRQRDLNILEGTRYKLFGEYYQEPSTPNSNMTVIGADFRHYKHIYRELTVAVRGAGAYSFGGRTVLNVLGGVDSELNPQRGDAGISGDQNYYYLTQAAPLRGFFQNSRNGSNQAVINSEVRWPVFKFFSKKPLNSEFTKTFMFTLFSDLGAAWNGIHPYVEDNDFNQITVENNPVSVTISNNRTPIIWGYGFGARAKILGYYVRADYGWAVDDNQIIGNRLHLSLNLDF